MKNKLIVFIIAVFSLMAAFSAEANVIWDPPGAYPDEAPWDVATNWQGNQVPGQGDKAMVRASVVCVLNSDVTVDQISVGDGGDDGASLRIIDGGSLNADGTVWSAVGYNKDATVRIEAGAVLETNHRLLLGRDSDSHLIVDGGTAIIGGHLQVGNNGGFGRLTVGGGGLVDVAGSVQLNGDMLIDIQNGALVVGGNPPGEIDGWIDDGKIVAFGGDGTVVHSYDVSAGKTTIVADDPETAASPSPANGASGVSIYTDLSWSAGAHAVSYDVYFGTNPSPGAAQFQGNQTEKTFDPGVLDLNRTYYWRVDAVNPDHPDSPWEGNVWSFTTRAGSSAGKIIYPWNAITSIVEVGDSFEVWFIAEPGQVVESVELHGPYNTIEIPAESVTSESGNWEYDPVSENTYNTHLTVTVCANTPADRYNLVLNTSYGQVVSVSAVQVIQQYKTNYKIFHIADSHLGQRGYHPLVENKHTALVNMANIINPDIIINAGDNVYYNHHEPSLQARMDRFYHGDDSEGWKGMHDFNAATFVVVGNHDFQEGGADGLPQEGYYDLKSDYWNRWHGLQYHNFKYGNSRFLVVNNSWYGGYDWSWQRDLAGGWLSNAGSGGNFRVWTSHIRQGGAMGTFVRQNDIDLVLIGHNHHLGDRNPYAMNGRLIAYYARAVREHLEFCLFLVDDTTGEYTPLGYLNTDSSSDGYGLSTGSNHALENQHEENNEDMSVWIYNLTLDYEHANDGSVTNNTATLVNKFDYTIPDARVRFVMAKGNVYEISQGTINQAFNGDHFHIVDVDIDLPANSTTTVDINLSEDAVPIGASAQGENAADNETADKAFDGDIDTRWVDFSPAGSWIQYRYGFSDVVEATDYAITSAADHPERNPKDWTLFGSDDGGLTWDTLDSRAGKTFTSRSQRRRFAIGNPGQYNIYRLEITDVADVDSADAVQIAELEFLVCLGPADINCDGVVDIDDLSHLTGAWLTDDISADIAEPPDGKVNFLDYSVLSHSWLMGIELPDMDVPNVLGQDQPTAQANIEAANLSVGMVTGQYDDTVAPGYVLSQDPTEGVSVEFGSWVDLVVSSGPAESIDIDWTNTSGDRRWRNSANWSNNSLPGHLNKAGIRDSAADGPIIDSRTVAQADTMVIGDWGNSATVEMTGGDLTTESWLILGFGSSDEGSFDISDGTVAVGANMVVARLGSATLNMAGGTITVNGTFRIAQGADSSADVFLAGGSIIADSFIMASGGWLDITEGTLVVDGNVENTINDYISNGWITAYEGAGTVEVDYDITNPGQTTVKAASG